MPPEEARAIDDVRPPFADQRDQLGEFFRRVLEVGVLNDDEITRHFLESPPERRALAAVGRLQHELEPQFLCETRKDIPRSIPRSIVHDYEFRPDRDRQDAPNHLLDRRPLVVRGHDDRQ